MSVPPATRRCAWQPLTPGGIAAFAEATFGRLLTVQLLVALLVTVSVLWFLVTTWFPVIAAATRALPEHAQITSGHLDWAGDPTTTLAESRFLAVAVDLDHQGAARSPAHVQVEFGRFDSRIISLFGFVQLDYRSHWTTPFNRTELVPWWEAWSPALLAMVSLGVLVGLQAMWWALSTLYFLPVWLAAFFADRRLSLAGSWRLAGASLMPGAFLMVAVVVAYTRGFLTLVDLGVAVAAHLVLGWIYLAASVASLSRSSSETAASANPFDAAPASSTQSQDKDR